MALKWRLCALLFLATTLNYLDRQTLSILAPTLQRELHLDNADLGWLFAVFYYAYTISQVAVGPLMDRFHLRWTFGLAVLLWSAVSAATGLVTGFAGLIAFRLLLGIAEAANWPGATRIVARTFEPAQRSLANGFFTSGTSVGALIAPPSDFRTQLCLGLAQRIHRAGYRRRPLVPDLASVHRGRATETRVARSSAVSASLRKNSRRRRPDCEKPRFFPVLVVAVLDQSRLYFSVNWLPTYFAQQRGLSPARSWAGS